MTDPFTWNLFRPIGGAQDLPLGFANERVFHNCKIQ